MASDPDMIQLEKLNSKPKKTKETKSSIKDIYQPLLAQLKEKISVINIRTSTVHLIIKYVMELVEDTPIKGSEQKELALKLVREIVTDLTEGDDERALLQLLDDGTISNLIDLISDASKGKLNINSIVTVSTGCINTCIPFLC